MNKNELIIQQHEENAWLIIDRNSGEVEDILTKDDIVHYCELEYDPCVSLEGLINYVGCYLKDNYNYDCIYNYGEEFDKFDAWIDYIIAEFYTNETIAYYRQRLLDFE